MNNNEYKSSETKIISVDIEQEMTKSFMDYSMSVIVSRALPDVRDGLKPVHRRILYTMFEAGLTPEKKYLKCAATVGDVLGKYHPHGDASVYDALVRLAQKFSMRYPLVDGHGNFGSPDGDGAAAYRYTEAKMSKIAPLMLSDIGKETVAYQTNYDDRLKEPVVLPGRYPNLLVNGSIGIAVGMATNIPPHNLTEVIDGLLYYIDNPEADWVAVMEYIKGPDFPTGAKIMGRSGIRSAYATGKGTIVLRAETHFEKQGGRDIIVADAMPYMTNKRDLEIRIAELIKEKRIEGVHAAHDYSGKDGIRFVVELNKNANPDLVLSKLYKFTDFQKNFSINMLALVDGIPKTIGIVDYLREYLKFQVEVITNRTKYDLKKALERAHILRGLAIAVDNVDEVLEILKTSDNIPHGRKRLEERFSIDEIQSEAIVQMTIGRITGLERQKILDELSELENKIAEFEAILADKNKILAIIKEELTEIKRKFGDPRRTVIEDVSGEVDDLSLIPEMDSVITYTNVGYVKRVPAMAYKSQNRGGKGVLGMKQRDEDFVAEMLTASTHEDLLFFTDKGRVFRRKGFEIPEGSKAAKG
ncbi:MAG: DNA topoisomerase 4 subunit A, partial [Ruminococcus sp.]|nr:DNA topoisomerase 4 subunit A [Ruminococcus sp.]